MDELNLAARQKSRDDIYYSERRDVIPAMIQDIARSNCFKKVLLLFYMISIF